MQTSYGFSGLLCFSKTNTNSHSHSAPALYLTTRAEARVGGNSCRQSFRATRTSSWMLTGIVKCFKAHPLPTQTPKHAKTCYRNVHACPCTKLSRFAKLSSRKSFLKEVRNSTVARESLRANKRSSTFHTCKLAVEAGEDLAEAVCKGEPLRALGVRRPRSDAALGRLGCC